jgi:hypothetical protein
MFGMMPSKGCFFAQAFAGALDPNPACKLNLISCSPETVQHGMPNQVWQALQMPCSMSKFVMRGQALQHGKK